MAGPFDAPPQPDRLTTTAEFVAALGSLRQWSGRTFRQLTAAAKANGDALPASTIAGALGRATLPREEFVAAFVRACGLGEAESVRWVAARKRLAAELPPLSSVAPGDPAAQVRPPEGPARRGPQWPALVGVGAGVLLVLFAVVSVLPSLYDPQPGGGTPGPSPFRAAATSLNDRMPSDGWYHMVPAHVAEDGLCIGEGRERSGRTDRPLAVQRPCAGLVPDTFLRAVGDGAWQIEWHHPVEGAGCLTVDEALKAPGALIAPDYCTGVPYQQFLLKPAGSGFVVRPLHSGLCVGALYGESDMRAGAEIAQKTCTGRRDQIFLFRPAPAPTWTPR
ncbi:XRE family transcriptional regulator [Microbispora cellulosiformans]|uniref:XRE family transcriptional regulator n=1 Tax=Microbispora cellulosiformans TaxID=2614688 RepID=A0A5J5K3G8_9ACTN|nr:XRE family transcriptional regulator [Microbispora cellulosiformans]KAA9378534.1 XRE family transcriptional regulator [Microbispora cellulosiformans]